MADGTLFGRVDRPRRIVLFAGIGGSCIGIKAATGQSPDVAINHWEYAIRTHQENHPDTFHFLEDVWNVEPWEASRGVAVDTLWLSPDCTHHSNAAGRVPLDSGRRALPWVGVKWAREVKPRIIFMENVEEIQSWGPLYPDDYPVVALRGRPIPERKGEIWREWLCALEAEGYVVEWRILAACDYGVPTTRERLYLIARRDGLPIRWPEPTHGPGKIPHRWAADCIDWSDPAPSIFGRKRDLRPKTQERIAKGLHRYVLQGKPYIVPGVVPTGPDRREQVAAWFTQFYGRSIGSRIDQPGPTITAGVPHTGLTVAWLAKHYGGVVGHGVDRPLGTITTVDHHSLCAASLLCLTHGQRIEPIDEPGRTITTARGGERALQVAMLTKYYGDGGTSQAIDRPGDVITTKARFGLVTVDIEGATYVVTDIGLRMLRPRELVRMQGFPDSYRLSGSVKDQIEGIGNSVCPPVAEALVRANMGGAL